MKLVRDSARLHSVGRTRFGRGYGLSLNRSGGGGGGGGGGGSGGGGGGGGDDDDDDDDDDEHCVTFIDCQNPVR